MTPAPRPATADDYAAFVRLFAELSTDDAAPPRDEWTAHFAPRTLFVDGADGPLAYVYADTLATVGYVRHIAVAREARRRGFGRRLMDAVAAQLRAAGCASWRLNVKLNNAPAIALYRGLGMAEAFHVQVLSLPWAAVADLPRTPRPLAARDIRPDEDAALEAAFDLPSGLFADYRKNPAIILRRLVDPERPDEPRTGVARFTPWFPGAYPFAVDEPAAARTLLEALRPHALPAHDYLRLVIEADPALADALVAAGAELKFTLAHYRGPLPDASHPEEAP